MKYCSDYGCGRLLPADHSSDECPYCGYKPFSWARESKIRELPSVAFEIEMKCHTCDSTEDLSYSKQHFYGRNNEYSYGNEFTCKVCADKARAELERQEAMNYLVAKDGELTFYDSESDLENYFENLVDDGDYEYIESTVSDMFVLKVEKMKFSPKASDFSNHRSMIFYDDEFYKVEKVIEPTFEMNGDMTVSI